MAQHFRPPHYFRGRQIQPGQYIHASVVEHMKADRADDESLKMDEQPPSETDSLLRGENVRGARSSNEGEQLLSERGSLLPPEDGGSVQSSHEGEQVVSESEPLLLPEDTMSAQFPHEDEQVASASEPPSRSTLPKVGQWWKFLRLRRPKPKEAPAKSQRGSYVPNAALPDNLSWSQLGAWKDLVTPDLYSSVTATIDALEISATSEGKELEVKHIDLLGSLADTGDDLCIPCGGLSR